jgi:FAD/FMN-containing dehydrogenase
MLGGVDDNVLTRALRAAVRGEVAADAGTRALYATDASNYRVPPRAVVLPRCAEDVSAVIGVCREQAVPLTARGAGTSIAGNAIGPGVILDFSRHLDAVLDLDPVTRLARVQPGVVLDTLQAAAAPHGLRFGPDPSSHSRCTLGGMIGNNACGTHSVAWGTTAAAVEELLVLLPDGSRLVASSGLPAPVAAWEREHRGLIRAELPDWPRRGSGYAVQHLLPEHGSQLARALVGTEGTCAVLLEATVRLVAPPLAVALLVLGFPDVVAAADAVPGLLGFHPLTVEGMDSALIDVLRTRRRPVVQLPEGTAWLLVEFGADELGAAMASAHSVGTQAGRPHLVVADPAHRAALWRIREAGAGLATRLADGTQAWPGWEDATVPPDRLGDYLRGFGELLAEHGRRGAVYGHFGEGCVHVRVDAGANSGASSSRQPSWWQLMVGRCAGNTATGGPVVSCWTGCTHRRCSTCSRSSRRSSILTGCSTQGCWCIPGRWMPTCESAGNARCRSASLWDVTGGAWLRPPGAASASVRAGNWTGPA